MAVSARTLKTWAPPRLFALGVAAASLRWLLLSSIKSVPWLLVLQPLHALSFGVVWIGAVAHLKQRSRRALATAQGLFSSALSLGGVSACCSGDRSISARAARRVPNVLARRQPVLSRGGRFSSPFHTAGAADAS
jgi:hypothetical protein